MSLQVLETAFQQDLNGNGRIGLASGARNEQLPDACNVQLVQAMAAFDPVPAGQTTFLLETTDARPPMLATSWSQS